MVEYNGKKYLVSHDVFLKMREHQKALAGDIQTAKSNKKEYDKAVSSWRAIRPDLTKRTEMAAWWEQHPKCSGVVLSLQFTKDEARHFNIVYSIVKGKVYSQVEMKVRKDNEPDKGMIRDLCINWGIDYEEFQALGQIVYG